MSVRHALLALLSAGSKYGFQLRREFEQATGDVWPLNAGQVYSTLQRLENSGLIESENIGKQTTHKVFRLTDQGQGELDRWLSVADMTSPPRDDLVIKVLFAVQIRGAVIDDVIQLHRRYLIDLEQQWTHLKDEEAEADLAFDLVVDAELFRLDSVIRWLDRVVAIESAGKV